MVSLEIWQAIHTPLVDHPAYKRGNRRKKNSATRPRHPRARPRFPGWLARHDMTWEVFFFGGLVAVLLLLGPAPFLLLSTLNGLLIATHIADAIATEKHKGRYELVALTPYGLAGTSWALGSAALHRHRGLLSLRYNVFRAYAFLTLVVGFPATIILVVWLTGEERDALASLLGALDLFVFAVIIAADYVQSTVIGGLAGLVAPEFGRTRFDIRNVAAGTFLALQLVTYFLVAVLCLSLWPALYSAIGVNPIPTYPFVCLLTFYGCREIAVIGLWLLFARSMNSPLPEVEVITRINLRGSPLFIIVWKAVAAVLKPPSAETLQSSGHFRVFIWGPRHATDNPLKKQKTASGRDRQHRRLQSRQSRQ